MQILKSAYIFDFIWKNICRRFYSKTSSTFWDMRTKDMWKVCLQTFRNNRRRYKLAYFLRNLQTSRANNSRILRIKSAKFSRYCFHMNTNIWGGFLICITVPLIKLQAFRPATLLKKGSNAVVFLWRFFKNSFFYRITPVSAFMSTRKGRRGKRGTN